MPGPILRKYGFPNVEKIFGERPLEHGVEDEKAGESSCSNPPLSRSEAGSVASSTPAQPTPNKPPG